MHELVLSIGLALAGLGASAEAAGDVQRGAALVASRSQGLCVLCHAVPGVAASQVGNLGPDLAGVGARLSADELRQRLLEPERHNPDTVMPSYGRADGLVMVARSRQGQPLLNAQQINDVLAYLGGLK